MTDWKDMIDSAQLSERQRSILFTLERIQINVRDVQRAPVTAAMIGEVMNWIAEEFTGTRVV